MFISRVDSKLDPKLPAELHGKVAIASARAAYAEWRARWSAGGSEFADLANAGASPQWLLWASTGTKNAAYSDVLYVETLIGAQTVNTIPEATLGAFRDHGVAAATLASDPEGTERVLAEVAALGIDLDAVGAQLQTEGLALFEKAFDSLLEAV